MSAIARLIGLSISAAASLTAVCAHAQPGDAWEIGPIIRAKNYSVGMPLYLTPTPRGLSFEFPYPDLQAGHVHYVTTASGPLWGKSRIVMRYRIEGTRGVRFVSRENPEATPTLSLFFQRGGDSWNGKRHEFFRWWSPVGSMREVAPGEREITVSLTDPNWISVWGRPASQNPEAFRAAQEEAVRVGFVFGTSAGRGHGVFATAPARFTILSFRII